MIIKPLGLYLQNFLSYGNKLTYIPLDFKKPTLIIGRNLDAAVEGQVDSNGAGKSVIINAVSYVTYDKTIGNKIDKDELINNINKKNMMVAFVFEKIENNIPFYYYIERFRKNKVKGGDGVRILKNTENKFEFTQEFIKEHDITRDSVSLANKQIEELIGMPFDVFSRIIIYSSSHDSFFSLPVTSSTGKACQSDIIEELFNITVISEKADILKELLKSKKLELSELIKINDMILSEFTRNVEQIHNIEKQYNVWDDDKNAKIKNCQSKIEEFASVDFDEETLMFGQITKLDTRLNDQKHQILALKKEIYDAKNKKESFLSWQVNHDSKKKTLVEKITTLDIIDFKNQKELFNSISSQKIELTQLKNKSTSIEKDIVAIDRDKTSLEKEIEHLSDNKCPYCFQNFEASKIKISENSEKLKILNIKKEELVILKTENLENIERIQNTINEIQSKLTLPNIEIVISSEEQLKESITSLANLEKTTNPHENNSFNEIEAIEKLESIINDEEKNKKKKDQYISLLKYKTEAEMHKSFAESQLIKVRLEELIIENNPHEKTLESLKSTKLPDSKTSEIEKLEDDIKHQEFLYKLLTKKDSFIRQALLAKNLTYLNSRLGYYLNKINLPHKVQFNFDLTTSISQHGTVVTYEGLSSGQKARVNIALSFAFRDVLQKRHGKIPLCILDECLDTGLGNVGIQAAARMIREVASSEGLSMFIISHRDEISAMFDSKLEVELKNRFSEIVRSDIGTETSEVE